jgi:transposase-like protein
MSRSFTRFPCQDCGGPKPPGRGERYCETCRAKRHVPTISLDDQRAIVRAYARPNTTLAELAARFYCSQGTISRVLDAHGVAKRPHGGWSGSPSRQRLSVDEELTRAQLYGQGYSIARIAEIVGRSPSSVHATLRRLGTSLRPPHFDSGPPHPRYGKRDARGRYISKEAR